VRRLVVVTMVMTDHEISADGLTVEHPAFGWNRLPQRPDTFSWWNGRSFTTVASQIEGEWHYTALEGASKPRTSWRHNPFAWIGLWVGVANGCTFWLFGAVLGPVGILLGIVGLIRSGRRAEVVSSIVAIVLGLLGTLSGLVWIALTRDPNWTL
jgi:hypothetical protein